jgi:NADH-quinone oxidoreductase subunit L
MPILDHLWIIVALPLLGSAINGLLGKKFSKPVVNAVGIGALTLAFVSAVEAVREFAQLPADQIPFLTKTYFTWIHAGIFQVDYRFQVDQLTVVMLLVVTGVALLVHIYSAGYMAHEEGYYRFFSYLNLFVFFMLNLVLAANVIVMFVGWEGVGLCSYLLVGFWFLKPSAISAGKKAFITTRIGDFGFTIGIMLLFWTFHSVDYKTIFEQANKLAVEPWGLGTLTVICILLFVGAAGKSAQLPLYVWLPDAMEGPTPVSALIHAATMVTAGVYMVARMNPLFSRAPLAMFIVALIGALTAFFAATIGLLQTDIKKVLAYSTISQLGYMFLACGVGAYASGVFHLMTHAFFKGLLFLAAGSVIHAMGGDQEMPHMGGLRTKIPITFWTMFIATFAIAGIPGFAGFFSKDAILEAVKDGPNANFWLWLLGVVAAGMTSFYMFRLIFLTFFGKPRYDEHKVHVHESPASMTGPLVVLAILSTVGGWFAAPKLVGGPDHFTNFLHPVFAAYAPESGAAVPEAAAEVGSPAMMLFHALTGWPVIVGLLGLALAWWFYIKSPDTPKKLAQSLSGPYTLIHNKYYVDEIYGFLIIQPLLWISTNVLWHFVDEGVIDGTVNGTARVARETGSHVREIQSGNARSYATWVVIGGAGVTVLMLGLWGMVR